jgi:hypothetical protein
MEPILRRITTAQAAQYFYTLALALLAFAIGYDWIADDKLPLWLGLLAALFGMGATGTAALRVRQQRKDGILP